MKCSSVTILSTACVMQRQAYCDKPAVCSVMITERLHSYYEFFLIVQEVLWNRVI